MSGIEHTDVVIVGAGFAGLSAAHELKKVGISFVLLEARDRVGGRVESQLNGLGERVDSGGQFLCDDMPEVMALARAHGKTLVETQLQGRFMAQPPMSEQETERVYAASMGMRRRLREGGPDDPAIAGLTVADWLRRQDEPAEAKAVFRSMIEGLWCVALEELPLWYLISNDRRITNEVSELQYGLAETMHSLADDMAAELGDRVRIGAAAMRIEHGPEGVRVMTGSSPANTIEARAVLVAVPPMMASGLDFSPLLPEALRQALGAWQSGAVLKVLLRYGRAFWRDKGLSGMVGWRDPASLFAFDASMDDRHPVLAFFVGGPSALDMAALGEAEVRKEILARLATALGPEAGAPDDVLLRDWTNDRWSGGAYSDVVVRMEARDAEQVLLAGAAPVFFASSELSPSFPGYVEGAIVAGRAAAKRVVEAVKE